MWLILCCWKWMILLPLWKSWNHSFSDWGPEISFFLQIHISLYILLGCVIFNICLVLSVFEFIIILHKLDLVYLIEDMTSPDYWVRCYLPYSVEETLLLKSKLLWLFLTTHTQVLMEFAPEIWWKWLKNEQNWMKKSHVVLLGCMIHFVGTKMVS